MRARKAMRGRGALAGVHKKARPQLPLPRESLRKQSSPRTTDARVLGAVPMLHYAHASEGSVDSSTRHRDQDPLHYHHHTTTDAGA